MRARMVLACLPRPASQRRHRGRDFGGAASTAPAGLRAWLSGSLLLLVLPGCAAYQGTGTKAGVGPTTGAQPRPASSTTDAQTFTRRYLQLLDRDDASAAYALLGRDVQARIELSTFQNQWTETREERKAQAALLRAQLQSRSAMPLLTVQALLTLDSGVRLDLRDGGGGLRLHDPELRSARPRTPLEALRLLQRAAEQRDLPALLRVLSPAQRQRFEDELTERLTLLRRALHNQADAGASDSRGAAAALASGQVEAPPKGEAARLSIASAPTRATGVAANAAMMNPPTLEQRGDRVRFRYDSRFFVDLRRDQGAWWVEDLN